VAVSDIWGVGRATTRKLAAEGIYTAADLRDMPFKQARALGTVVLERTAAELRGEPCIAFEDVEPQRKGMAVTRSSGRPMKDFDTIMEALTAHATRAAEKLRRASRRCPMTHLILWPPRGAVRNPLGEDQEIAIKRGMNMQRRASCSMTSCP